MLTLSWHFICSKIYNTDKIHDFNANIARPRNLYHLISFYYIWKHIMKGCIIDYLLYCLLIALPDYVIRNLLVEPMIDQGWLPTEIIEDILNTSMNGKLFDI